MTRSQNKDFTAPLSTRSVDIKPKMDIVIPVHNSVHWLNLCLQEVFRFHSHRIGNVTVVDDRSEPEQSIQLANIVGRYPKANLVSNSKDHGGFGFACNLGANSCGGAYLLFLNTDCLITENTIDSLADTLDHAPDIVIACPVSNNSPNLTYGMWNGRSFRDMAQVFLAAAPSDLEASILEACTVVGNCLAVKRHFFETVGGFSPEWKEGYGEETELQMKAFKRGLRGVVNISCYVYHHGGGTFDHFNGAEILRTDNHKKFMNKWKTEYRKLEKKEANRPVVRNINEMLSSYLEVNNVLEKFIDVDVLFYLPGIRQDIGGLSAVIHLCNALILEGVKATCALVGPLAEVGRESYKEPVFFEFLVYASNKDFLRDATIRPNITISTIWTSSVIVSEFAKKRGSIPIQFVQGYEGYFQNGADYGDVIASYSKTETLFTTSQWLFDQVGRHLSSDQTLIRLPLPLNPDMFFSSSSERDIDVLFTLRSAPDKGQWLVVELLQRLSNDTTLKVAVIAADNYAQPVKNINKVVTVFEGPLDQHSLARIYRRTKLFVDLSHHEGYGLMAAEAAMSGCRILSSDNGGIDDLAKSHHVVIAPISANPKRLVKLITSEFCRETYNGEKRVTNDYSQYAKTVLIWHEQITHFGTKAKLLAVPEKTGSLTPTKIRHRGAARAKLWIYRQYKYLRPFVPHRLKLALKALIFGRI